MIKLSAPQFILLGNLVSPNKQALLNATRIPNRGDDWLPNPEGYRADTAKALVRRGMAVRTWINGCPYMQASPIGITHWNEVNAALRSK